MKGQPQPKPESLPEPVPGQEQKASLVALLDNYEPVESAQPEDEVSQALAEAQTPPPAEAPMSPHTAVALNTLHHIGAVLDAPGGLIRGGLAEVAGLVTGQGSVMSPGKDLNYGEMTTSAEYLERLGVPAQDVTIPFTKKKISLRGAEGLALDIATDPLSAISKLIKEVPYIGKLLNAPGAAAEAVGEQVYKSGLKKVDAALKKKGEAPVSDLLLAEGKTGTTAKLAEDVDNMSRTMGGLRKGLYDRANQLGVQVDLNSEKAFRNSEAVLKRMRRDPNLAPLADELESMVTKYKETGKVPIDVLSEWKTNLYSSLPQTAYEGPGKLKGLAKQYKAALASDMRQMIIDTGNKAEKGLGDSINKINEKWGTLISAADPMAKQAKQAAEQNLGDWIDATIIGGGMATHPVSGILAVGGRKAAQLANTTYAKTKFGKAMIEAGRKGLVDAATRRALVELSQTIPENIRRPEEK